MRAPPGTSPSPTEHVTRLKWWTPAQFTGLLMDAGSEDVAGELALRADMILQAQADGCSVVAIAQACGQTTSPSLRDYGCLGIVLLCRDLATCLNDPTPIRMFGVESFEQVCRWYLRNDPSYRRMLHQVWLWDDWPGRTGPDTDWSVLVRVESSYGVGVTTFPRAGDALPEITLPDLDGTLVSLSDFRGERLVVFMWASW